MHIRYFAWLKQRTGVAEENVSPPGEITTVGELMNWLGQRHPRFREACEASGVVRCAVNQVYADRNAPIGQADEIAFFPPVTGG